MQCIGGLQMLVKFFRPEHVESFLAGDLYFKNAGYFIDLEARDGDKGIGDRYEGSFFRHFDPGSQEIYIVLQDGTKVQMQVNRAYFTERYEAARKFQLTCFTGFPLEDMVNVSESELKIKEELLEELKKEFPGRVPVLISDEDEFFNRVENSFKELGIGALHGYVKYFDEYAISPLEEVEYEKDIAKAFLNKRDYFKAQREYRIITREPVEGDSLTINLGNINDIAVNLKNIESLYHISMEILDK
jgi:hypothetical protein